MKPTCSSRVLRGLVLTAFALLVGVGCSSAEQDEENLETTNEEANDQGDLANNEEGSEENGGNEEGSGQANFGNGGNEAENGAETNSVVADDTSVDSPEAILNNGAGANTTAGMVGANSMSGMPTNSTSAAAGMPSNAAAVPMAAATSENAPISGGRVRYVPAGGVQVVNAPGGSVVASLEQGDHPVTWEENGYLKLGNGMYVPIGSLSDQGVPRPFSGAVWQQAGH